MNYFALFVLFMCLYLCKHCDFKLLSLLSSLFLVLFFLIPRTLPEMRRLDLLFDVDNFFEIFTGLHFLPPVEWSNKVL